VKLVIEALGEPIADGVKCVVVGDGEESATLRQMVSEHGLSNRVTFLGQVDDDELLRQLSRCRAVCFPAQHEDYGLVTVEAFASGKPVVTCTDSGGPAELVRDHANGFVTEPVAAEIASKLALLSDDRALAERLGATAFEDVTDMTWERASKQLVLV